VCATAPKASYHLCCVHRNRKSTDALEDSLNDLARSTSTNNERRRWIHRTRTGEIGLNSGNYENIGHPLYDPVDHLMAIAKVPDYDASETLQKEAKEVLEKHRKVVKDVVNSMTPVGEITSAQDSRPKVDGRTKQLLMKVVTQTQHTLEVSIDTAETRASDIQWWG
jgi:hypothetical protein